MDVDTLIRLVLGFHRDDGWEEDDETKKERKKLGKYKSKTYLSNLIPLAFEKVSFLSALI